MRVALALGGGGARGYAHIGVIEVLRQRGHEIVAIAGTSMGAVVGGLTAAGTIAAYTDWVVGLTKFEVVRLLGLRLGRPGLASGNKLFAVVGEMAGDTAIEDLPIPYTAVATDLDARREVWFQRGSLLTAIRASSAIPGVFLPVEVGGRLLVDGGLCNPVPVEPLIAAPAELTIAVSLSGSRRSDLAMPVRASAPSVGVDAVAHPQRGLMAFVDDAIDTMQAAIGRLRNAAMPPDLAISIPFSVCGTLDFHRAAEVIDFGRRTATEALDAAGM